MGVLIRARGKEEVLGIFPPRKIAEGPAYLGPKSTYFEDMF